MSEGDGEIARLVDQHRRGDVSARSALVAHANGRLRRLAHRMLRGYPKLRRWEQTGDVLNEALLRLWEALKSVKPKSALHFHRLAAQQIRRALIDLGRHHLGPHGDGAHHHTDGAGRAADDRGGLLERQPGKAEEPASLGEWTRFHEQVEALPEEERAVFDLLWYQGLRQEGAAALLGVSERTLKRRWQSARRLLSRALGGDPPG